MWAKSKQSGFTIVELLIVIVVIGILAAITLVAYNGIQNRATISTIQAAITQANQKVVDYAVTNSDQYPVALADAGVVPTGKMSYQYTSDNTVSPNVFCITATIGTTSYYIQSNGQLTSGICPGHNLLIWDKLQNLADEPVPSAVVDTSVFHTSIASMRLGPLLNSKAFKTSPYTGTAGQTYTVSLWIKTDPAWDGTNSNSKIRFGDPAAGTVLLACGYGGAKTTWTLVTCSYTLSAVTTISISVGNDSSTYNIWIDDLTLSKSV